MNRSSFTRKIRQKNLEQSSDALDYLASEIPKTSLIEMKSSMNRLIQSQLETQMMAKIGTEYAVRIIEPPFVPERKFKPNRIIEVGSGFSTKMMLNSINKNRDEDKNYNCELIIRQQTLDPLR